MDSITYRVDLDGTIAEPRFFQGDLRTCIDWYIQEGIVRNEEVLSLQYKQQLFLLPHVLLTHRAVIGAIETLQQLYLDGRTLQYFTVRQAINPDVCQQVHANTRIWLREHNFPYPESVQFFWDAGAKLTESLKAEEDRIILIDDRPDGLLHAYQKIEGRDPRIAQQIRERVRVLAFGTADLVESSLNVIPCPSWSSFGHICDELERK